MSKQTGKKYLDYTSSEITILCQEDQAAKVWQDTASISLDKFITAKRKISQSSHDCNC